MKKIALALLSILLAASFMCCKPDVPADTTDSGTSPESTEPSSTDAQTDAPIEDTREVFVYTGEKLRIQLYSDSLIRIEEPKSGTYEDRASFCCVNRGDYPGVNATQTVSDGVITLTTDAYTVKFPEDAAGIKNVTVNSTDGTELWKFTKKLDNLAYLPEPCDTPQAWAFNDSPRLIPSSDGFDYNGEKDNGWTYTRTAVDYFVFLPLGNAKQLRYDFNLLTGQSEFVPLYALGFWFSRFFALSDSDVLKLIDDYRKNGYPIDVFVVDTDWRVGSSTGYKVNKKLFPDIEKFYSLAAQKNVHILMNDHVREYSGSMFSEEQLTWFKKNLQEKLNQGLSAWWYDRNWSYALNSPFAGYSGDLLGQAMYSSYTDEVNGDLRTLLLSNAYFIYASNLDANEPSVAAHRYSVQWTGDIDSGLLQLQAELEHAVYTGASAGMTYLCSDIGGHLSNPTEDVFIRWTQYGALSNIMRYHSNHYDRTPWVVGETADEVARTYINMRYRLLPLYYSLARLNYETGMPIMKRLDFEYPQYEQAADNTEYMLGDAVIVAPITVGSDYGKIPSDWFTSSDGSSGLDAEYYTNQSFSGEPTIKRVDGTVYFNVGTGAVTSGIPADNFSIRWSGKIRNMTQTNANLAIISDDGMRVYLDDKLILDCWKASDSVLTENFDFILAPGEEHDIRVEYYEIAGNAKAMLLFAEIPDGERRDSRSVFLPDGEWMDVWSGKVYTGPVSVTVSHTIKTSPIFVKLGSLLVLANNAQSADTSDWDKLTLDIYPGGDFSYTLYEDDGMTEAYKSGAYRKTDFTLSCGSSSAEIKIAPAKGDYTTDFTARTYTLRMHLLDKYTVKSVKINGEDVGYRLISSDVNAVPFAGTDASADGNVAFIEFSAELSVGATVSVEFN